MRPIVMRISTALTMLCMTAMMFAQMPEPVKCKTSWTILNDSVGVLRIAATIDKGWHVYSTELEDGPTAAILVIENMEGAHPKGKLAFEGKEIAKFDEMFGMEVRYFEEMVTFVQQFIIEKSDYKVSGYFQYGACDDESCMPPTDVAFKIPMPTSNKKQ